MRKPPEKLQQFTLQPGTAVSRMFSLQCDEEIFLENGLRSENCSATVKIIYKIPGTDEENTFLSAPTTWERGVPPMLRSRMVLHSKQPEPFLVTEPIKFDITIEMTANCPHEEVSVWSCIRFNHDTWLVVGPWRKAVRLSVDEPVVSFCFHLVPIRVGNLTPPSLILTPTSQIEISTQIEVSHGKVQIRR